MNIKYKYVFAICFAIFLVFLTTYILLDTFVISKKYAIVDNANEGLVENINAIVDEKNYIDDNITIKLDIYRKYDTNIYVADVIINDPKYLKTAFAYDSYGKNIIDKTSSIAISNNAILAINGDYYGIREKGYVLRNGVIYRDSIAKSKEDLIIYNSGEFDIIKEEETDLNELLENGVYNLLSFGPALIIDNEIVIDEDEDVSKYKNQNPRTAIGMIDNLHYVFIICDGRVENSTGLYLYDLAVFMKELGVTIAYNLDGGGTTSMYFNGNIINNSISNGIQVRERSVSDIVYIGY